MQYYATEIRCIKKDRFKLERFKERKDDFSSR